MDGLAKTESSGNPYAVNPDSKALGTYQFTPDTLVSLHKQGVKFDPLDPAQSRSAADYLYQQKLSQNGGDQNAALAAYGGFKTKDPSDYIGKVTQGVQQPVNGSGTMAPMSLSGAAELFNQQLDVLTQSEGQASPIAVTAPPAIAQVQPAGIASPVEQRKIGLDVNPEQHSLITGPIEAAANFATGGVGAIAGG